MKKFFVLLLLLFCINIPIALAEPSNDAKEATSATTSMPNPYKDSSYGTLKTIDPLFIEGDIIKEEYTQPALITLINYVLMFVGVIALIVFIMGGYLWITALGDDSQIEKAKKTLLAGVIGIFIIISSYAIVSQILSSKMFKTLPIVNI